MSESKPLGRKKGSSQGDWRAAYSRALQAPDRARAAELVEEAAARVSARLRGERSPVYGWSGGKDSIALEVVCSAAGVGSPLLVLASRDLEYPEFEAWAKANAPQGLTALRRNKIDLDWLRERPQLLFPATSDLSARWYQNVQHAGQREHMTVSGSSILLLGRRTADGNFTGRQAEHGREYVDREGFVRFSPIAGWSHEDVLNVIAVYRPELPPIYKYPRGFEVGTGPWAARSGVTSLEAGWAEVFAADPRVVETAAEANLPGAAQALTHGKQDA